MTRALTKGINVRVSFAEAERVAPGLWLGQIAVDEIRVLPGVPLQGNGRHVVLLRQPAYDEKLQTLQANLSDIRVLLAGSVPDAIFIQQEVSEATIPGTVAVAAEPLPSSQFEALHSGDPDVTASRSQGVVPLTLGRGDLDFIQLLEDFDPTLARLGKLLLERVRQAHKGELRATDNPKKFTEWPDNFWAVELQNRLRALKVIVRARHPEHLRRAGLNVRSERPPVYWYLKLAEDADLEPALKMISLADRR